MKKDFKFLFWLLWLFIFCYKPIYSQKKDSIAKEKDKLSFKDTLDGAFDVSSFLDKPQGFIPIPIIITEPAVGYGGGLAALFFHPQKKEYDVNVPPNITGIVGLGTTNKTWAAALFHFHVWGPDKIRYFGAIAKPSVNIKYYGDDNGFLSKNPVQFNLDSWLILQRAQFRIGKTDLFIGAQYTFFKGKTEFEEFTENPIINELLKKLEGTTTISGIEPIVNWDSRNNIFTPTKGVNTGFNFSYNATWLGSNDNYYTFKPYFLAYKKINENILSSWRFDSSFMFGDAPFFAKPFIQMRGVPAMKYQSDNTMLAEMEWKFKIYRRWSIDVFTGTGKAFQSFQEFAPATWVYSYGIGFRYKIARAFGIDAGLDFAWSNNKDFAFTIVFGSAWNR